MVKPGLVKPPIPLNDVLLEISRLNGRFITFWEWNIIHHPSGSLSGIQLELVAHHPC